MWEMCVELQRMQNSATGDALEESEEDAQPRNNPAMVWHFLLL